MATSNTLSQKKRRVLTKFIVKIIEKKELGLFKIGN